MQGKVAIFVASIAAALIVVTMPATAVASADEVVRRTIEAKIGRGSVEVTGNRLVDGITIRPATGPDGRLPTYVQDRADGFALMAVLNEGQSSATFNRLLAPEQRFEPNADGGLTILEGDKMVGYVEKPWASDAKGRELMTKYVVNGDSIRQEVDTRGAMYPIVADPSVKTGWHIVPVSYVQYTWTETWYVKNHIPQSAIALALLCSQTGPAAPYCGYYRNTGVRLLLRHMYVLRRD
jgi:hypothetical protein